MKALKNIQILTRNEYRKKINPSPSFEEPEIGIITLPDKTDLIHREICFLYFIKDNILIFGDDSGKVQQILNDMEEENCNLSGSPQAVFCEFLDYLTKDELSFLQSYEQELSELEESLMHYDGENISRQIIKSRKELLKLQSCYYQLIDLGENLRSSCPSFARFTKKMERLLTKSRDLREYSLQIRELYQTQIAVRQNKIMQLLTMVTTIFMPLTLLTGWYGMNFRYMPEITCKYGYPAITGFSVILIILEIRFFKRRRWFL